ncbi:Uncharacterised protein [Bordetella pertussis]|nr:Uncharacterised protein [Bordetella pertussis]CPN57963.1 Uncharacterised protein [Bordetella pertussis]
MAWPIRSNWLLLLSYSARRPLPSISSKVSGRSWRMVTILPLSAVATPNWLPAASSLTSSLSEVSVISPRVRMTLPVKMLWRLMSS